MGKDKTAACLTIWGVGDMTPEGRKAITKWLRKQASWIDKYGDRFTTGRFVARYIYTENDDGEKPAGESPEDVGAGGIPPVVPEGLQSRQQGL
jgi:hypothetical protein